MATKKQILANRANAERSTGPKTAAGKRKSSRNALKHGLCSSSATAIWDEDPGEFEAMRAALEILYPPINILARELVRHLADLLLRLRRPSKLEAATLGTSWKDTLMYLFHMAEPDARKRVLERLRQLRRARLQHDGADVHWIVDLGHALTSEMPDVVDAVMEAEMAREPGKQLAVIDRHETSMRNGIRQTMALLETVYERQPEQSWE